MPSRTFPWSSTSRSNSKARLLPECYSSKFFNFSSRGSTTAGGLTNCQDTPDNPSVIDAPKRHVTCFPSSVLHSMKLRSASMTVVLALGITAAVVIACTAASYIYSVHHFQSLLETARHTALAEGDLIRVALEHQMIENDRTLIAKMIESFGKQERVEQLMLLDRNGVVRYSSKPGTSGDNFRLDSPTCQVCHRDPPDRRGSSRVIETRGGEVLRTVVPIRNRE